MVCWGRLPVPITSSARFESLVQEAASDARRQLTVRQRLSQALHHPEVMAMPETAYLKGLMVEV